MNISTQTKRDLAQWVQDTIDRVGEAPAGKSIKREVAPGTWYIYIGMTRDGGRTLSEYRADVAVYLPESYGDDDLSDNGHVIPHKHGCTRDSASFVGATTTDLLASITSLDSDPTLGELETEYDEIRAEWHADGLDSTRHDEHQSLLHKLAERYGLDALADAASDGTGGFAHSVLEFCSQSR